MSDKRYCSKVLFVIPYLSIGGAERALSNIVMHFPDEWKIDILVNSDKRIDYPYRGRLFTLKVDENPRTESLFFQAKVFVRRVKALKKLKKDNQYVACISFLDSANVANILSGRRECRVIVSVRSSLVNQASLPQYRYIVNPLVRFLYNKADKIVAVSKGCGVELEEVFNLQKRKIVVIENGYDIDNLYQEALQEIDSQLQEKLVGKTVIVFSGRLTEVKGLVYLFRAFAQVAEEENNVVLLIVGEGESKDFLVRIISGSSIEEKIYFVGYQSNPYQFVAKADIFIITSLYEGFPNALAEAVCLGIPCIATDFQTGAREILAPELLQGKKEITQMYQAKFGIITPLCSGKKYKNIEEPLEKAEIELVKAMLLLVRDKRKRQYYAAKSRQRGKEFDISYVVERWLQEIRGEGKA